jgi:hypothetical protein
MVISRGAACRGRRVFNIHLCPLGITTLTGQVWAHIVTRLGRMARTANRICDSDCDSDYGSDCSADHDDHGPDRDSLCGWDFFDANSGWGTIFKLTRTAARAGIVARIGPTARRRRLRCASEITRGAEGAAGLGRGDGSPAAGEPASVIARNKSRRRRPDQAGPARPGPAPGRVSGPAIPPTPFTRQPPPRVPELEPQLSQESESGLRRKSETPGGAPPRAAGSPGPPESMYTRPGRSISFWR